MALTKIDDRGLKTPIDLLDNEKIRFGTGNDLELYHSGTESWIKEDVKSGLVKPLGWVQEETKSKLMQQSTLIMVPSEFEGQPAELRTAAGRQVYADRGARGR